MITLNPNGHWESGNAIPKDPDGQERFLMRLSLAWNLEDEEAVKIAQALLDRKALPEFINLGPSLEHLGCPCSNCEQELMAVTNGLEIKISNSCEFPLGVFPIEVDLNIPSGKIVFANDLRKWFDYEGEQDVSNGYGLNKMIHKYSEIGMAFSRVSHETGFNGYFCVSTDNTGQIFVHPRAMKLEGVEEVDLTQFQMPEEKNKWQEVGRKYVAGSSHCWCAVDYDDLKSKFKGKLRQFYSFLKKNCVVLDVDPGLYRVSNTKFVPGYSPHNTARMEANIKKISEPREVKKQALTSISAGQIIWQAIRDYPSLYLPPKPPKHEEREMSRSSGETNLIVMFSPESKEDKWQSFLKESANQDRLKYLSEQDFKAEWNKLSDQEKMMSVHKVVDQLLLGSSAGWNPGGWCGDDQELVADSYEVKIPIFPAGLEWSSVCIGHNAISKAIGVDCRDEYHKPTGKAVSEDGFEFIEVKPAYINESFRALAFNMLNSIIRGGPATPDKDENDYIRDNRLNSPKVALLFLKHLAKLFPQSVPEYCKDLV